MNETLGSIAQNTTTGFSTATTSAQRVVPLLASLQRTEELAASLAMRLDPVTNHAPRQDQANPPTNTVTSRINQLGDTLQYLLDNIEL